MKRTKALRRQTMRRIRVIGLAVVAVFAVSVVASATAMAVDNPVLVHSNGAAATNLPVTGKDTKTSLLQSAAGSKVECESAESIATLNTTLTGTGKTSGIANVTFKSCKSAAGKCSNTSTAGEITGTVATLLVWIGKESNKTVGVLVSPSGEPGSGTLLSFKCAGVLTDVEGAFITLTSRKLGEVFTTVNLIGKEKSGVQEDRTYTENGIEQEANLCTSSGGEAFATAGEELDDEEAYTTSVKVIED
jgi:hypothetical protein